MLGAFVAGCGGGTENAGDDQASVRDKFGGRIVGIEPGAGIMKATEKAIKEYGLEGYELQDSSSAGMVAALKKAINDKEWIVVTGWTPHWKFAKWDLKYLEDPKGIYGGEEEIDTIVTPTLKDEAPAAYQMLDNFYWKPSDMEAVMLDINVNEMDPDAAAEKFIKEHQDMVNEWIPEGVEKGKDKIVLGYVEWDSEIASTHVVKHVLMKMGYDVELQAVDAGVMWQGIGAGSFDAIVAAWLPTTHKDYYEKVKDKVENLGPNLEGTRIGLVVPKYVTIDSIEDMAQ
ncbi:MAG: glycine/betaine ABC transporter [Peptococcaceae bacterium]|nr:glycine/betaine ABC transporter [Peptococcaceae bacterium]